MDDWKVGTVLDVKRPKSKQKDCVVITEVNPEPGVLYRTADVRSREGRELVMKYYGVDLGKLALDSGTDLDKLEHENVN